MPRRVDSVDIHVRRRVRTARLARGMSQEKLADAVGVSFQQIQKYEKGTNRIGTGRLYAIARLLELPLTYFFEGVESGAPSSGKSSQVTAITQALSTREGVRIAAALARIEDSTLRYRIADLLEAIIADESREVKSLSPV